MVPPNSRAESPGIRSPKPPQAACYRRTARHSWRLQYSSIELTHPVGRAPTTRHSCSRQWDAGTWRFRPVRPALGRIRGNSTEGHPGDTGRPQSDRHTKPFPKVAPAHRVPAWHLDRKGPTLSVFYLSLFRAWNCDRNDPPRGDASRRRRPPARLTATRPSSAGRRGLPTRR